MLLAVALGIASGFPLKACDKLKDVKEGADNYNMYLIKLNDSNNYKDAEHVINLVKQYQATLEQDASNVHEPSVRSQLELTENAGVLHGTLSQQALFLVSMHMCLCYYKHTFDNSFMQVCLDNRVEFISPDYIKSVIFPQSSGEPEDKIYITDCPKLVLKEPNYSGTNYTVTFKPKTTLDTLYHVITILELAKLTDNTITFSFYYAARKGSKISMAVEMNTKAIEMVRKYSLA